MVRSALIVVDVQVDFCPGGALQVQDGDEVVPVLNRCLAHFEHQGLPIALTQDFHPANHASFSAQGGPWPPHCVQGTVGVDFHPDLLVPASAEIFRKGTDPRYDAYSGFQARDARGLLLEQWLRQHEVDHLVVGGLATDYCVQATVLDGLGAGFAVTVLQAAIRGVNVHPGDSEEALVKMVANGAQVLSQYPF